MAKRKIKFNKNEYSIEESKFDPAVAKLINYFSTELAGTGVTLIIGGVKYNLDGTKVGEASNVLADFATDNTGTGHKMSIGGTGYEVSEAKLTNAVGTVDGYLATLASGTVDPDSPDAPPEPVVPGSKGLAYILHGDGYALTGFGDCTDTDIIIPAIYKGLPVNHIVDYADTSRDTVTSITIPGTVKNIGESAFRYLPNLTQVTISEGVEVI